MYTAVPLGSRTAVPHLPYPRTGKRIAVHIPPYPPRTGRSAAARRGTPAAALRSCPARQRRRGEHGSAWCRMSQQAVGVTVPGNVH